MDFLLIKLICALLRTVLLSFAETVWGEGSLLSVPIYPFFPSVVIYVIKVS